MYERNYVIPSIEELDPVCDTDKEKKFQIGVDECISIRIHAFTCYGVDDDAAYCALESLTSEGYMAQGDWTDEEYAEEIDVVMMYSGEIMEEAARVIDPVLKHIARHGPVYGITVERQDVGDGMLLTVEHLTADEAAELIGHPTNL